MNHPDYEPDVEFWRPEDRAAEKLQDVILFDPCDPCDDWEDEADETDD